jgi:hypothetical protein
MPGFRISKFRSRVLRQLQASMPFRKRPAHKVFGIGLNKTGTKSLGSALATLGYVVSSWSARNGDFVLRWHEGRFTEDVRKVVTTFDGFEDFPWPLFYRELDALVPDARFVLTVRETPERWLASMQKHLQRGEVQGSRWVGHFLVYGSYDAVTDAEKYLAAYRKHVADVQDYFRDRPGKLLVMCMERGDGWRELCGFLGLEIPKSKPFPHRNRAKQR